MFYTIDWKCITLTQWIVRQFELYTNIERSHLINFFISALKCMLIIGAVVSVVVILINKIIFSVLIVVNILVHYCYAATYERLARKETLKDGLPTEIISRYPFRLVFVLVSSLYLLLYMWMMFLSAFLSVNIFEFFMVMVFFNSMVLIFCFLEYLLCTTSLPPGEKQKRLEEKEMRNMIPIPIKH